MCIGTIINIKVTDMGYSGYLKLLELVFFLLIISKGSELKRPS